MRGFISASPTPTFLATHWVVVLCVTTGVVIGVTTAYLWQMVTKSGQRGTQGEKSVRALTGLARVLAGCRYAHLPEAWDGDQYDPDTGEPLPTSRRLRLARGNVLAALRCRLDDAADQAWRPVDALLSSWHGSNLATLVPVTVTVGLVLTRDGFYGLIVNADNLGIVVAAPYAAIKGLRRYRQITTPKRPEKKASSADRAKR